MSGEILPLREMSSAEIRAWCAARPGVGWRAAARELGQNPIRVKSALRRAGAAGASERVPDPGAAGAAGASERVPDPGAAGAAGASERVPDPGAAGAPDPAVAPAAVTVSIDPLDAATALARAANTAEKSPSLVEFFRPEALEALVEADRRRPGVLSHSFALLRREKGTKGEARRLESAFGRLRKARPLATEPSAGRVLDETDQVVNGRALEAVEIAPVATGAGEQPENADLAEYMERMTGFDVDRHPIILRMPDGPMFLLKGLETGATGEYYRIDGATLRGELARQGWADVGLVTLWDEDRDPIAVNVLVEKHAAIVHSLVYDLTGQRIGYEPAADSAGGELWLPCARRDARITAAFDERCARYLKLLFGAKEERGLDWLATVGDLSRPTAALYLQGPPSAGKGLLANAVARLWNAEPAAYGDVAGAFNSALKRTPIVFLDESAPKDLGSGAFRSLISESARPLTEKCVPTGRMFGCVRLMIAANNEDALRIREDLTVHDEIAIGQRIFHVDVGPEAGEYLEALGGRSFTAKWINDGWGAGALVRHLRWIEENRTVNPGHRFTVSGDSSDWIRKRGLRGGLPQVIIAAIATDATSSNDSDNRPPFVFEKGRVLVQNDHLRHHWERLTRERNTPSAKKVGDALATLAGGRDGRVQKTVGHSPRCWYWQIDADVVLEVSERLGVGSRDVLRDKLGLPPEAGK